MAIDFVFDLETFGNQPDSAVIDLSVITFNSDPNVIESFEDLVNRGLRIKFDLASQKGKRIFYKSTVEWWKGQSQEAKKNLARSPQDVSINEGLDILKEYLDSQGIDFWKSQGYSRGMSFDFPILKHMITQRELDSGVKLEDIDTFKKEFIVFWNQNDTRTSIRKLLLDRDMTMCPIRKGVLNGFVLHDSIHDCAKDIIMLKTAERYALGLEEVPDEQDIDPVSIKK